MTQNAIQIECEPLIVQAAPTSWFKSERDNKLPSSSCTRGLEGRREETPGISFSVTSP